MELSMKPVWKKILWRQFGAAIEMLENAITHCPEALWSDRSRKPEFWYVAFHTLFYLDLYLSKTDKGFVPPAPFTLDELDERGLMPDRVYTKEELLAYLGHGRAKCQAVMSALTDEMLDEQAGFDWLDISVIESHLYNMRHIQHHVGQLNMMLSREAGSAPRWVRRAGLPLAGMGGAPGS